MKIESGVGNGRWAAVDKNNRLTVASETFSYQHVISRDDEQAYQVIGTANVVNGEVTALVITNTSVIRNCIITYMRHQVIDAAGGTAFPSVNSYMSYNVGRKYSSGGTSVTPVNMAVGSGNLAEITAYSGGPTLAGTAETFDRWYTQSDGDMNAFNKNGALIIQPGQSIDVSYTSDHTSGLIYTRVSFVMEDLENNT